LDTLSLFYTLTINTLSPYSFLNVQYTKSNDKNVQYTKSNDKNVQETKSNDKNVQETKSNDKNVQETKRYFKVSIKTYLLRAARCAQQGAGV
jgi:hypothetical protein